VQDEKLLWKVMEKWGETLPVALFSRWLFEMNRRARFESEWDITIVGIGFECNRLFATVTIGARRIGAFVDQVFAEIPLGFAHRTDSRIRLKGKDGPL
jgi:hypothetical protein